MSIGFGLSSRNWWRAQGGGGSVADDRFIISVKTDNAGTSASNQFTIPTSTSGITQAFNYDIETSDGQTITGVTGDHTITFPTAGTYEVRISGSFPYIYFNGLGDRLKLLSIENFGIYGLGSTSQQRAFRSCSNLVVNATDIGHFENVTDFVRIFEAATSLITIPAIDMTGNNLTQAFNLCSSLQSFPFTAINGTCVRIFDNCVSLTTFPANVFDTNNSTQFNSAFANTNLTSQSIDNILVSLDTAGLNNGLFTQSGGQAPSATGQAAIVSLVAKGWTVTVTGGYTP